MGNLSKSMELGVGRSFPVGLLAWSAERLQGVRGACSDQSVLPV